MSSASRHSYHPGRRVGSLQSTRDGQRSRAGSRARLLHVNHDDAYSFALRIAFLNYLLQPRKKRKEYVAAPKPLPRAYTSSVGDLMKEFVPTGTASSTTMKLPHSFRAALEKRFTGVLRGVEKLPGFNDAAVKRTFAEAYTAFTAKDFQKSIDKDRKVEPLILIFYTSATKAQGRGKAPDDHSWKMLVDRHLAMFVRLVSSVLRDLGAESGRPELMRSLNTLENKLLTNDQDLYLDTGQQGDHSFVEVEIPLTYELKDMPMVQVVAKIFGLSNSQVQGDIDSNLTFWTEEAALKDYKNYQARLSSNMSGTLHRSAFDLDEAYAEWKKNETPHLVRILAEILAIRPELRGQLTGPDDKPLPLRPTSLYGEEQAYADLSKLLSNVDADSPSLDMNFGAMSNDEMSSIRSVDEASYTFIPPEPRSFYKSVLQYCVSYDLVHSDPSLPFSPLSEASLDLLTELAVRWRIPQVTRHVTLAEVTAKKFLDQEISPEQVDTCLSLIKEPAPVPKKPPLIQGFGASLADLDTSRWTMVDFTSYRQVLRDLSDALLRDLYTLMLRCYESKPPSVAVVMTILHAHIFSDGAFSQNESDMAEYTRQLEAGLRGSAAEAYRNALDQTIPRSQEEWDFGHVVKLGKAVVSLCERIKKRYRKNPEIMGVNPFKVLVETMFPSFQEDAQEFIKRVIQAAEEREDEIELQDGFDLYKELVEIRKIHTSSLPGKPFGFHIEGLLDGFVWRWIKNAEQRMEEFVEGAIKQDQFQVRTHNEAGPTDEDRHSVSIIDTFSLFNQTVDQVYQLQWADEVHHARFMTALAKAFAAGLGRYCEIVEQRFAREMDRQTVQEVAAMTQTTQEKFMQYAKDAWNTKEKIEPFQFYSESFVKLNNIEYAMQALDKLEKHMNVDACANLLQRVDGPKAQVKKPGKYVFTVKIVEAEDLKACDPTGTSDPYVVLGDEYQKRLAKTRIVMRNLNPRWDESIDITVTGPINIIATIWDYDTFGDHDFVGRTSIKLDPVHFSDYLPREFWLDLDTQGRLLLRVSMEGERDDIEFYFGKAFRHLKRTERDMVRKITDKLNQHINVTLSREALRGLLSKSLASSMANLWKKRQTIAPSVTPADVENALQALFIYFDDNFAIMKQTLTDVTMRAVMARLWKEVLMAIESLLVPPLSEKPSTQKSLTQAELDVVFRWLELLFDFFNARDEQGVAQGIQADVLKSPKWHELASLNFFYFDSTENLIRTSERMAAAAAQRQQQQMHSSPGQNRLSAPPTFGPTFSGGGGFGSMGTIRRGKSIMMSRNLGTMRKAKEEKRKEAQADPSDDMILRILRMRPEATNYLKERYRQKERMAAAQAAALIVQRSVNQGWNSGTPFGGALYGRNNLPRR